MQTPETVEFYYANLFAYYFIRICGTAFFAGLFYWLFRITVEKYLTGSPFLYTVILSIYGVVAFLIVLTVPMLFAMNAAHGKADALFYQDRMELRLGLRKTVAAYADITQISWYWTQLGSSRSSQQKRHKNYQLKI